MANLTKLWINVNVFKMFLESFIKKKSKSTREYNTKLLSNLTLHKECKSWYVNSF